MNKIIILTDTFIDGTPVGQGSVVDVDDGNLNLLTQAKRCVLFSKASAEQKALIKKESK